MTKSSGFIDEYGVFHEDVRDTKRFRVMGHKKHRVRAVKKNDPPSLESLLEEAGSEFDHNVALQQEFAVCTEPRQAWLAYIKSVYEGTQTIQQ